MQLSSSAVQYTSHSRVATGGARWKVLLHHMHQKRCPLQPNLLKDISALKRNILITPQMFLTLEIKRFDAFYNWNNFWCAFTCTTYMHHRRETSCVAERWRLVPKVESRCSPRPDLVANTIEINDETASLWNSIWNVNWLQISIVSGEYVLPLQRAKGWHHGAVETGCTGKWGSLFLSYALQTSSSRPTTPP